MPLVTVTSQIDRSLDAVVRHIGVALGDPALWEPAPGYASTALAAIDSVWSIGVRYRGVLNVLERYRLLRADEGADAEADTPADLVSVIERLGGPDAFAGAVRNRQRTSSRNGVLKAAAVLSEARMLVERDIAWPADLSSDADRLERVRRCWVLVPGQGSGISWDYFLMLNGLSGVKADRMVRRFVASAITAGDVSEVSADTARRTIKAAADALGVEDRILDYAIWRLQSGQ